MTDLQEKAMRMALEALDCLPWQASPIAIEATNALRQALAQPEQEPVKYKEDEVVDGVVIKSVYTAPPHYWGNVTSAELVEELRRRDMLMVPVKEHEPVAVGALSVRYFRGDKAMTNTDFEYLGDLPEGDYTLYTAPPMREWVGLTDEQIEKLAEQVGMLIDKYGLALDAQNGLEEGVDAFGFARAIEAKLKEKNA